MKIYHTASERSNTRYLERLIINAEYVSTVQRPNEDHVSHRLYQISMPPQYVAFDQNRNISLPRCFREILCICRGYVLMRGYETSLSFSSIASYSLHFKEILKDINRRAHKEIFISVIDVK